MSCKISPPNIAGTWKIDTGSYLQHTDVSSNEWANICYPQIDCSCTIYDVEQKNLYVTFKKRVSSNPIDEMPLLGVWKPIWEHGKAHRWELILTTNSGNGTYIAQVYKHKCECCPTELFYNFSSSGFDSYPTVGYGYFKKVL